jgi:hypothetical protein
MTAEQPGDQPKKYPAEQPGNQRKIQHFFGQRTLEQANQPANEPDR